MATISKQEGGSNRSKLRPPSQNIHWKLRYGNFDFCRWVVVIDRFDQVTVWNPPDMFAVGVHVGLGDYGCPSISCSLADLG
jgi:hypothetical protein